MKKCIFFILSILFMLSITGCTINENVQSNSNQNSLSPSSKNTEVEVWQNAYVVFLNDLSSLSGNSIDSFALRDLDSNGVPELIIIQQDENAMNATLTVYSYNDNVYKIGDYSNPAKKFIDGFRFSNNPMVPGLFECWWGGGVEHYGYLLVEDGKLIYEHLWSDDRTVDPPHREEISPNKQLINESIEAYPPYDYTDNILEMHLISNDNFDEIIKKTAF